MEDKQVELGAEETQQAVETTEPQPSLEELRQAVEAKETEIRRLQGILRKEQSKGVTKAELESITKRIDSLQEWNAEVFDDLARRLDSSYEEPQQVRKSYKQTLEEQKKASTPVSDPTVDAFFDYMTEQGLSLDDDVVKDALGDVESPNPPKVALKNLKEKMKTKQMSDVEKMVETKAEEKARSLMETKLKELGLTSEGVGAPSAPSGRVYTRKQIADMPMNEYAANKAEIDKAEREGRIR